MSQKLNVLVLPSLFPENAGDSKGIFVLDYIQSVLPFANVKVFTINLYGKQKGIFKENFNGIEVHSLVLSETKNKDPLSKLLLYKNFFTKGVPEAKKLCRDIDIIHVHNSTLYGNIARALNKATGIPYIITEHTGPFSKISANKINRNFAKRAWKNCSGLLAVSNDLREQIIQSRMNPPQIVVTFNPVNTEIFSLKKIIDTPYNTITFASRLEDYKGAFRAAKAFALIAEKFPQWKLVIMGEGHEKILIEKFIDENKLTDKIILTGKFNKQLMMEQFHRSSFFVFPSEHETFGLVVAEAMSCGLPVITGDKTALPEIVDDTSGMLVNASDINAIASAIEKMILNYKNYSAEKIRERIVNRFGFEMFGKKLITIYTDVINNVRNSRNS